VHSVSQPLDSIFSLRLLATGADQMNVQLAMAATIGVAMATSDTLNVKKLNINWKLKKNVHK